MKVSAFRLANKELAGMVLHECLENFTPKKRLLIHLRFWEQRTIEEIASSLSTSWGEMDKLINEAIRELKGMILERLEGHATLTPIREIPNEQRNAS